MTDIRIERVEVVDDELVRAIAQILPHLGTDAPAPSAQQLSLMITSPCSTLLVARDPLAGERIVGMVTLVTFRRPTGLAARLEDLVVETTSRHRGIGEALCRKASQLAEGQGARFVELTSNPAREAANRLYVRLGFEKRNTNVYHLPTKVPNAPD